MTTTEILFVLAVGGGAALIKSITGMGYPLVLLPVLALFIDVADAIVIVAPSNFVLNLQLVGNSRHEWSNATTLPRFLVGGVVGAVIGSLLLPALPNNLLRVVLVVIIVLFLVNSLRSNTFELSERQGRRLAPAVGGLAGLFQGGAGVSGPIVTPWFLSVGISRDAYLLAIASTFSLTGVAQIVVLAAQGLFTAELFALSLALIPLAFLVFPLGVRIRERISVETFHNIVLVLLAVSAVSLLVRIV